MKTVQGALCPMAGMPTPVVQDLAPLPSFRKTQRLLGSYQPCSLRVHSLPSAELSELADWSALLRSQHLPYCGPFRLFMATSP